MPICDGPLNTVSWSGAVWPPKTCCLSPPSCPTLGFEKFSGVYLCHKVVQFVGLGDCDPMVPTFDLAPVQLAGEGCDVGVGRVTPDIGEVRIEVKISLGSNDLPRLELLDHRSNVLGLVIVN